ncbi:hypothetical protein NFJ02_37g94930 [Pycnococcus provasolii]
MANTSKPYKFFTLKPDGPRSDTVEESLAPLVACTSPIWCGVDWAWDCLPLFAGLLEQDCDMWNDPWRFGKRCKERWCTMLGKGLLLVQYCILIAWAGYRDVGEVVDVLRRRLNFRPFLVVDDAAILDAIIVCAAEWACMWWRYSQAWSMASADTRSRMLANTGVACVFHRDKTPAPDNKRVGVLSRHLKKICHVCMDGIGAIPSLEWKVEPDSSNAHVLGATKLGTGIHGFNPFLILIGMGLRSRLTNGDVILGRKWAKALLATEHAVIAESPYVSRQRCVQRFKALTRTYSWVGKLKELFKSRWDIPRGESMDEYALGFGHPTTVLVGAWTHKGRHNGRFLFSGRTYTDMTVSSASIADTARTRDEEAQAETQDQEGAHAQGQEGGTELAGDVPEVVDEVACACTVLCYGGVAIVNKLATHEHADSETFAGFYHVKPRLASVVLAEVLEAARYRDAKTAFVFSEESATRFYEKFGFVRIDETDAESLAKLMYDNPDAATVATVARYSLKYDISNEENNERKKTATLNSVKHARGLLNKTPPESDPTVLMEYNQPRGVMHTCYGSAHAQRSKTLTRNFMSVDDPPGNTSSFKTYFQH